MGHCYLDLQRLQPCPDCCVLKQSHSFRQQLLFMCFLKASGEIARELFFLFLETEFLIARQFDSVDQNISQFRISFFNNALTGGIAGDCQFAAFLVIFVMKFDHEANWSFI